MSRMHNLLAPAMNDRHLDWDGCFNVRDLGGLPTADGRVTRPGAVVRADAVDRLTESGWAALKAHGIRTIIDLRNDSELETDAAARPDGIQTVRLPLDGVEDSVYWDAWATEPPPLYYRSHLEHMPERSAAVLTAIAEAPPGGVLVHCVGGVDRTGLISLLLLALAGVVPENIANDHSLSTERVGPLYAALGLPDRREVEAALVERGTSGHEAILATLATVDVEERMRGGGLDDSTLIAIRERLLGPPGAPCAW
jgi:protein-tyrosine phosphatase